MQKACEFRRLFLASFGPGDGEMWADDFSWVANVPATKGLKGGFSVRRKGKIFAPIRRKAHIFAFLEC